MKARRFVFASLAFLFSSLTGTAIAQQCSHVRGTWTDNWGYEWYLSQGGYSVSGEVFLGYPPCAPFWSVSGSTTNGYVSLGATHPWGATESCTEYFSYDGTIQAGGCRAASGNWTSWWYGEPAAYGSFSMTKACEVPGGEYTDPTEREENWVYSGGAYVFDAWVSNGSGGDLSGRAYRETDYAPASDECWFEGTPPNWRITGVTNHDPFILSSDNHYQDTIGWTGFEPIDWYCAYDRTPCQITAHQRMQISCGIEIAPSPWENVESQVLWQEIGTYTHKAARGSVLFEYP